MKDGTPELCFASRSDFRDWLRENAETSGGVWLMFGKTQEVKTLIANDALEEALCFGWIDGQMKSIDDYSLPLSVEPIQEDISRSKTKKPDRGIL